MYSIKINNGVMLSALSIQGKREQQQDYYSSLQLPDRTIAIVCDGMGGLQGGSVASKAAAEQLMQDFQQVSESDDLYAFFAHELIVLDDLIYGLRNDDGSRLGAGTTLVSILMFRNRLYWFSVGDSKLYYLRGSEFCCVTREHNYALQLQEMREQNIIDEKRYQEEQAKGEQLISYLGSGTAELFDGNNSPFCMQKGDRILLCTDGLYRTLSDEEIHHILCMSGSSERICKMLENAVLSKNKVNQDNATWIVIQKIGD